MNKSRHNRLAFVWLLIVGLLLAHNAYLWLDKRVSFDTNILALLPKEQRDPVLQQAFNHMVDSAQQQVAVLIGANDWPQAVRAADAYTAVINSRPDLIKATDTTAEKMQSDWLAPFTKIRLGLLTPEQQTNLQTQPAQYWVNSALSSLYNPFAGPKLLGTWQDDPFGLFTGWAQARAQETPVRPRDGKLFVADQNHAYVVLLMQLRNSAFSMTTQAAVMPLLEQAKAAAQQAVSPVEVISAGVVLHAAEASQQANHEMSTIAVGSLLGIILLMWLTFRSLKPILLIGLSIGVGCLGALSVCWILFGQIHLLTLVFGASLIGVAQDYGIYFLCSRAGAKPTLDSYQLLKRLWPGLTLTLTAALVGYLGLALTPFPGLQQMAVFSGLGLLFAWLSVVCWFPVLIKPETLKATHLAKKFGASRAYWPTVQMNWQTLCVGLLFCLFTTIGLVKLTVSDDIRALQKPSATLLANEIKLSKLLDAPSPVQFYLVRGATEEIVLQHEEALKQLLEPLISQKIISGYQAVSNWVPSEQMQIANQQLIKNKLFSTNGPLKELAVKLGENNAWVTTVKDHALVAAPLLTPDAFLTTPASAPWRYLWLGKVDDGYASIVALRGLNNYANLPKLQTIATQVNGVQWVDKVGEISSVLKHYRQNMSWVLVCAYLSIYLLLFIRYRIAAWRVLMPPAIASIATVASLGMFSVPLQLFHVLALMLVLGLGVDYGIFLQEQPNRHERYAWLTVGLSAVSALLSFGLLALSKTPPLHAFGLTMLIGMATVWLIAPCFVKPQKE